MTSTLDIHRFTSEQTTKAAGITLGSLGTWLKRGDLAFAASDQRELHQPGTGRSRRFSARRVLHIALIGELTRLGMLARQASLLALAFTDHNQNDQISESDTCDALASKRRAPGEVFPDGGTIFRVMFPSDGNPPMSRVERFKDIRANPFVQDGAFSRAVLMVDLDSLHNNVWKSLDDFMNDRANLNTGCL